MQFFFQIRISVTKCFKGTAVYYCRHPGSAFIAAGSECTVQRIQSCHYSFAYDLGVICAQSGFLMHGREQAVSTLGFDLQNITPLAILISLGHL